MLGYPDGETVAWSFSLSQRIVVGFTLEVKLVSSKHLKILSRSVKKLGFILVDNVRYLRYKLSIPFYGTIPPLKLQP